MRLSFSLLLGTIALVGGIAVHMLRRAYGPRSDQLALPKQAAGVLLLRAKHLFVAAKRALAATKARGVSLGGHREQSDINKAEAVERAPMDSITSELSGLSARGAAEPSRYHYGRGGTRKSG